MKLRHVTFCPETEFPQNVFGPRLPCGYPLQNLTNRKKRKVITYSFIIYIIIIILLVKYNII